MLHRRKIIKQKVKRLRASISLEPRGMGCQEMLEQEAACVTTCISLEPGRPVGRV